jgi:hypothetical protein
MCEVRTPDHADERMWAPDNNGIICAEDDASDDRVSAGPSGCLRARSQVSLLGRLRPSH